MKSYVTRFLILTLALFFVVPVLHAESNDNNDTDTQDTKSTTTQVESDNGEQTKAQLFTDCSQKAIEARDEAIASAREIYNTTMSQALKQRKDEEKGAVAAKTSSAKKVALRNAIENYKNGVTSAQDTLTSARKDIWASFDKDMKSCRNVSKQTLSKLADENLGTLVKEEEAKLDNQSLLDSIRGQFEALKSFFWKK